MPIPHNPLPFPIGLPSVLNFLVFAYIMLGSVLTGFRLKCSASRAGLLGVLSRFLREGDGNGCSDDWLIKSAAKVEERGMGGGMLGQREGR